LLPSRDLFQRKLRRCKFHFEVFKCEHARFACEHVRFYDFQLVLTAPVQNEALQNIYGRVIEIIELHIPGTIWFLLV
jgi:hypothetical protein